MSKVSAYAPLAALDRRRRAFVRRRPRPAIRFHHSAATAPDRAAGGRFRAAPDQGDEDSPRSLRGCKSRSSITPPAKRRAPSSSIRRTPSFITCSATARRCATASASAARASPGPASRRSRARPSGRTGTRRRNGGAPALPAAHDRRRPGNPLGARAMYLGGTDYRIHGTNDPDDHRQARVVGLHPADQRGRERSLQPRSRSAPRSIVLPQGGAAWRSGPRRVPRVPTAPTKRA